MSHPSAVCAVLNCPGPIYRRGWCCAHYNRWVRNGDPGAGTPVRTKPSADHDARFRGEYEVDPATGCWLWTASLNHRGYAKFQYDKKCTSGHIWSWTRKNGPVPPGKQLDHYRCDTRRCVNPDHVRPATSRENTLRGDSPPSHNLAKTECIHGHPFDDVNTYVSKHGYRQCRECSRRNKNERRRKERAKRAGRGNPTSS